MVVAKIRRVPSGELLGVLQAADSLRKWYSLDDRRVCVLCDQLITGRQIEITQDSRGHYTLECPTPGCRSSVNEWFYPATSAAPAAEAGADLPAQDVQFYKPAAAA